MSDVSEYVIRAEMDGETARIRDRLAAVGMMHEDIDPDRSRFWVAEKAGSDTDSEIVGTVRLELDRPNALVGSLYVASDHRNNGLGGALIDHVDRAAQSRGVTTLYLFSTDAGTYFEARGYEETPVEETVVAVSDTPQAEYYRNRPELLANEVTFRKSIDG
ncbi:GNAT family N-acetyltransferase [Halocatena salina]|uniref:GNAT family N-acetyltransferase n=1 Tax=Halocatena salina TaxID=2934340 RepID=A0A8U0A3V7_9EURY|nr:GNAT family N-acetyltransferase [Halocatena salina]UPM43536.1 GNAT family N-acetyltransferase [Halocatena salina]